MSPCARPAHAAMFGASPPGRTLSTPSPGWQRTLGFRHFAFLGDAGHPMITRPRYWPRLSRRARLLRLQRIRPLGRGACVVPGTTQGGGRLARTAWGVAGTAAVRVGAVHLCPARSPGWAGRRPASKNTDLVMQPRGTTSLPHLFRLLSGSMDSALAGSEQAGGFEPKSRFEGLATRPPSKGPGGGGWTSPGLWSTMGPTSRTSLINQHKGSTQRVP